MTISNTELATKLDDVATGWQQFVDETITWTTSTNATETFTDPVTGDPVAIKTPYQMQADYAALLDPVSGQLAVIQAEVDAAEILLTDATAAQAAADAAKVAAEAARDSAQSADASASTSASNAATSEANAATSETNAGSSATSASTAATNAATSETNAAASASAASTSETNAAASEVKAAEWATKAEDVEVETGQYSAYHWAQKALGAVSGNTYYEVAGDALEGDMDVASNQLVDVGKITFDTTLANATFTRANNTVGVDIVDNAAQFFAVGTNHSAAAEVTMGVSANVGYINLKAPVINFQSSLLSGLADPVAGTDAANRNYVDTQVATKGVGDLLADGSVPLTANWDMGSFEITTGSVKTDTINEETAAAGVTVDGVLLKDGLVDGRDVSADGTKLDGIESGATADMTGAEIKAAYEAELDTNAFTDADHSKLDGIESGATADQTDAEIETAYNNQVAIASQAEAEAGTSTSVRRWTPQRVKQAIDALGGSGGGLENKANSSDDLSVSGTNETTLYSYSVPGGAMGVNDVLHVHAVAMLTNNSGGNDNTRFRVNFGGTEYLSDVISLSDVNSNKIILEFNLYISNDGSASSQRMMLKLNVCTETATAPTTGLGDISGGTSGMMANESVAKNTASAQTVEITFDFGSTGHAQKYVDRLFATTRILAA